MSRYALIRVVLLIAIAVMAGAVWVTGQVQSSADRNSTNALGAGQRMLTAHKQRDQATDRSRGQGIAVAIILALGAVFALLGWLAFERPARREARRRRRLADFGDALQVSRSEREAFDVLKRHLERWLDKARAVVLVRNSSANRLQAATGLDAPTIVGGEVVGSVLIQTPGALHGAEIEDLVASVGTAGPAIANLRNLAIAELRAATDALTGLANHRSVQDSLNRMVARAAVAASVRESDFVGRYGGEEFVALLPDTDRGGGATLAEKLRLVIEGLEIPDLDRRLSASFGVAVLPGDAVTGEQLLRAADRALYAAKNGGRNRVEVVRSGELRSEVPQRR